MVKTPKHITSGVELVLIGMGFRSALYETVQLVYPPFMLQPSAARTRFDNLGSRQSCGASGR